MHRIVEGIVLRETDTKEADKILTVLTKSEGKISVIARGARRKNSRIAAASQLLVYSEMTRSSRPMKEMSSGTRSPCDLANRMALAA